MGSVKVISIRAPVIIYIVLNAVRSAPLAEAVRQESVPMTTAVSAVSLPAAAAAGR